WLKGKKNIYPLGDIQAVKYREEKKKSYTLYGIEISLPERTIYLPRRSYLKEIQKDEYVQIIASISEFIEL
ncbi:MAG: hypothetical protein AAFY76_24055, partial [Cyanobacteria bacterium J06649_11]